MGSVAGERDPKIEPGSRTRKPTQKQGNATVRYPEIEAEFGAAFWAQN